jgi:hypothetical protein
MRILIAVMTALALSGCASTTPRPQTVSIPVDKPVNAIRPITRPAPTPAKGLETVIGKDGSALTRLFGPPRIDVVEVVGRKMQFAGRACILDAYLYPDGKGGTEVVTHIDARRSDGAEVDRVQCVNALMQR